MRGLTGKKVAVAGASRGIGLAVVRRFLEEGAHVVFSSEQPTADIAELIEGHVNRRQQ